MTRPLCADLADAAGDAREGTAPPARQWFLVEHPGPWPRVAHAVLPEARALDAWAHAVGGRVLLIRRPALSRASSADDHGEFRERPRRVPRSDAAPRWFRVDSRPGHDSIRAGLVSGPLDPTAPGNPYDGPLHLVCAHGRHDACCAVRGRPLAAALAAADPAATWECSHIGGCRFAPALVLLPHGLVLGGVPVTEGVAVTTGYAAGLVDPRYVRGRSALPPAVQAAQHHARLATGARGVDGLRVASVTAPAPGRWRVTFTDPAVAVDLAEHTEPAGRPLTCAAPGPGRLRTFTLLAVTG